MKVEINTHAPVDTQLGWLGDKAWSVARLIELTKDFEVMEIPLSFINMSNQYSKMSLRELAGHAKAIQQADLSYPIILSEDGEIMDGRHRLMKALIDGVDTIKAVRFETNPVPCNTGWGE